MKRITVDLPDRVYEVAEAAIRDGYFASMDDVVRVSVMNFVRRSVLDEIQAQQLEDIRAASQSNG